MTELISKGGLLPITDPQAKAVEAVAKLGQTVVEEGGKLARYMGRVLGTAPDDAVGLLLTKIIERRNIKRTQPVSPSVAIPLLSAAYDEGRPELQQLWAELIAAAMDPNRSNQVRLSFVATLKHFDPLDALLLKARYETTGPQAPNDRDYFAEKLHKSPDEIEISAQNLQELRCIQAHTAPPTAFWVTAYGRELLRVCTE
jgi:hypothetical protein